MVANRQETENLDIDIIPSGWWQAWWRWTKRIAAVSVIGASAIFLLAIWEEYRDLEKPLPPLLAQVGDSYELTQRLLAHHPLGSLQSALVKDLEQQGFKSTWSEIPGGESASYSEPGFPCSSTFVASWKTDEKWHITSLAGYYRSTCL